MQIERDDLKSGDSGEICFGETKNPKVQVKFGASLVRVGREREIRR
jgi:hypothetical protein